MRAMKDSGVEWIGEIPQGWGIIKSKYILSANDGGVWGDEPKNEGADKVVIRSTEQTVDGKWCIVTPAKRDLSKEKLYSRILCGDLLITKSSGSEFHIGKTTIAGEYFIDHECYHSNFLQRIRCSIIYKSRFLWYLLNSNIVREQFVYLQNSTSGIGNINADNIKNIILPYPDKLLQQKMVDYLDSKCSKIDAIIEKQQAVIEKLKEYKLSVITEAVTKGLNPDVGMKDSGVEWIGEVPKHWDVIKLKWLLTERKERSKNGEEEPLSMSQKFGLIPTKDMDRVPNLASSYIDAKIAYPNDLVFNKLKAHLGVFSVSKYFGVVSPDYSVYYTNDKVDLKYLEYLFKTPQCILEFRKKSSGVAEGLTRLYTEGLYSIKCPYPSLEAQIEISCFLNKKCKSVDVSIERRVMLINNLVTYKKSLIYEVVTGKKEV